MLRRQNTLLEAIPSNQTDAGSCDPGWVDASLVGLGCLLYGTEGMLYYEANTLCQVILASHWS